jgi:hypothetical protein
MSAELRLLQRGESKNCVATLEEMLADAKSGKLVAVGIAAVMENGGVTRAHAGDAEGFGMVHLLGGIHLLAHSVQEKILARGG